VSPAPDGPAVGRRRARPSPIAASLDGARDTIVALATAPGRSALAVVRLSGPDALAIAGAVLEPLPREARAAHRVAARDPATGELLDRPVVTVFRAPRSYTGEDVVEISTHGGLAVPTGVIAALVSAGARPARPGEFTRRAVLHGKLDIAQAEAVGDLIDADSAAMRRAALAQLDGGLSRRIAALRDGVLGIEALIAYDIDFPEEDDGPIAPARVIDAIADVRGAIGRLQASAAAGALVRAGALVVIAGAPNAGKSSLFNALVGRARALVSDVPGTTRDAIEVLIEPTASADDAAIAGRAPRFPLRLVDTAGLRDTSDVVERLGIEVSERYVGAAQVVLACGVDADAVDAAARRVRPLTAAPVIGVRTKSDLAPASGASAARDPAPTIAAAGDTPGDAPGEAAAGEDAAASEAAAAGEDAAAGDTDLADLVSVSAEMGTGLSTLLTSIERVIERVVTTDTPVDLDAPVVTSARHRAALGRADDELCRFLAATSGAVPAVVAAVHLRAAVAALDDLIGVVRTDDVLDRLFSDFCIGK